MFKLVRSAALASLAALAGCAPVKLSVAPAAAYDPAAPVQVEGVHARLVANFTQALHAQGYTGKVVPDGSATVAARMLLNRQAEATGVLPSEGRGMLHEAGIADLGARWFVTSVGYNDRVPEAADLADLALRLGALGNAVFVGVADLPDPVRSRWHYALVAVPRVVALGGLARQWEPSTRLELTGQFLETVTDPQLRLLGPDGSAKQLALSPSADGAFAQAIEVPAEAGQYVLEIAARWRGAERVLVAAPVGVGAPVAAWPPRAADLSVTTEKELQQALVQAVAAAAGKPLAEKQELSAAAQACAEAVAGGKDCAATAGARVVAFDVAADAVERMVSEIVALPTCRAAGQAEAVAIAAVPTLAGQFVVALAMPAPAPAAEPEAPAAEPEAPAAEPEAPAAEPEAPAAAPEAPAAATEAPAAATEAPAAAPVPDAAPEAPAAAPVPDAAPEADPPATPAAAPAPDAAAK